jgi:hypothetical protein
MKRIPRITVIILLAGLFIAALPIAADKLATNQAQTPYSAILFTLNDDVGVATTDGSTRIIAAHEDGVTAFHHPTALPEMNIVFFLNWLDDNLWFTASDGSSPPTPVANLTIYQPLGITTAPDGRSVGVAAYTSTGLMFTQVYADGMLAEEVLLSFIGGCSGTPQLPDTQRYIMQTGPEGNPLLLEWVSDNTLLLSQSCNGTGVQILTLENQTVTVLDETLYRAKLSPDKRYLAGFTDAPMERGIAAGRRLRIIDLQEFTQQNNEPETANTYTALPGADQVFWTADGELIVSVVIPTQEIAVLPQDTALAEEIFAGLNPLQVPLYYVGLYKRNPSNTAEQHDYDLLWEAPNWRGVPMLTAGNDALYFSAIDNLQTLITALNDGEPREVVFDALPGSSIYRLDLTTAQQTAAVFIPGGEAPILINLQP